MNSKRKIFLIDFGSDYEVWLSTSKEQLIKNYKDVTGVDIYEEEGTVVEIPLEGIKDRFKFVDGVTQELLEDEYKNLQKLDEDVMFFTNML